jgi:hypothetical protein
MPFVTFARKNCTLLQIPSTSTKLLRREGGWSTKFTVWHICQCFERFYMAPGPAFPRLRDLSLGFQSKDSRQRSIMGPSKLRLPHLVRPTLESALDQIPFQLAGGVSGAIHQCIRKIRTHQSRSRRNICRSTSLQDDEPAHSSSSIGRQTEDDIVEVEGENGLMDESSFDEAISF